MIHFNISNYTVTLLQFHTSKSSKPYYIYQGKLWLKKKKCFLHIILSDKMSIDCIDCNTENSDTEKHCYDLKGSGLYQKEK